MWKYYTISGGLRKNQIPLRVSLLLHHLLPKCCTMPVPRQLLDRICLCLVSTLLRRSPSSSPIRHHVVFSPNQIEGFCEFELHYHPKLVGVFASPHSLWVFDLIWGPGWNNLPYVLSLCRAVLHVPHHLL